MSPNGTRIGPPSTPSLDDAQNVKWAIRSDGYVLRNNIATNGKGTEILFQDNNIFVKSPNGGYWFLWKGNNVWEKRGLIDPGATVPAPPPPPPAPVPPLVINTQFLNMARLVEFDAYHRDSRYERFRRLLVLSGDRASVKFQAYNLGAGSGGIANTFNSSSYTLLVDGAPAAVATIPAGSGKAAFDVDLTPLAPGWRRLDIDGLSGGESCPTYWAYVKRGPVGDQPFTPVVRGTYDLVAYGDGRNFWAQAPGKYNPTPRPITAKRTYLPPSPKLPRAEMNCEQLVPVRYGDIHRPNRNVDGLLSSFDVQTYFWSHLHAVLPAVPLLDGPRGVGTVCMATHIALSTAAPGGILRNATYFSDPWRIGKVSEDGTITTLAGYRHKNNILAHWEDDLSLGIDLIGDWSTVPEARRGFHEIWGFAWDERTLAINESAAPIPDQGNDKPHVTGPAMFVADSQRNRIVRVEFSAFVHGEPPKVTEFITDLADPWDVVYYNGRIYVSERKAHRIAEYDATTGTFLRAVVVGEALAIIDINREVIVSGPLASRQAAPCVAPEGLAFQDGWLYFASKAQALIKRVHLETGVLEAVRPIALDGNSKFAKVALSDGTFGPRGSTFTWTWSSNHKGGPEMWGLINGVQTPLSTWWNGSGGTGHWADQHTYATAGAIGQGRMITASVEEGMMRITRSQPGDMPESAATLRGRIEFYRTGLHLLHGASGFGFYGISLPWGVSADIDAFLESHGHPRST